MTLLTASGLDRVAADIRPVEDGPYWVGIDGRVFSDIALPLPGDRVGEKRKADPARRAEIKPTRRASGYYVVSIDRRQWKVHVLVLTVWVGPRPPGMQCRHLDGNKSNNRLENLVWGTPKENGEDNVRLGVQPRGDRAGARLHPERLARGDRSGARLHPERVPRGERNGMAKLTATAVAEIRQRAGAGEAQRRLAREFGVSRPAISAVVKRETWRHVA